MDVRYQHIVIIYNNFYVLHKKKILYKFMMDYFKLFKFSSVKTFIILFCRKKLKVFLLVSGLKTPFYAVKVLKTSLEV